MADKSPALVLSKRPYGDKSLIINFLTQRNGLISCFSPNAFSKTRRLDRLQPLTGVEIVYSLKENRELGSLREIQITQGRQTVFSDVLRTSVAFYMAELLNRVVRQHLQPDERLFALVQYYMSELDTHGETSADLHIRFTFSMIEAMGFKPSIEEEPVFFNLVEGVISHDPFGKHFVNTPEVPLIARYFSTGAFDERLTRSQRISVFNTLMAYLDHQLGDALNLKSPAVLHEILND